MRRSAAVLPDPAGDGSHAAMPADEYDGDETLIALEYDPWEIMPR